MNRTDHWGGCTPFVNDSRCLVGPYKRNVSAPFGSIDMTVYEPCNYASNVAYFRSATRICNYKNWSANDQQINAAKRGFVTLGMGSAFWHGSHTFVGYEFDNNMIAVISYLAHQQSVELLKGGSVLHELSLNNRTTDSIGVADILTQMTIDKGVPEWAEILDTVDMPHVYFTTFAALIATGVSLVTPFFLCRFIITHLSNVLVPPDSAAFI